MLEKDQIYNKYVKLRKREQEILQEHEELRKAGMMNEDFKESSSRLVIARRKLDEIETSLSF